MENELPSLIREKRLSDVLDEPGDDKATETKVNSKGGGNNRFNITMNEDGSMYSGSQLYSHQGENSKTKNTYKKSNEIYLTRKNMRNKLIRQSRKRSYGNKKLENQLSLKTNENRHQEILRIHSQLNRKQQHKVILPGVQFGWLSQEVPRVPPPSKEMKHRMRIRMKLKKRRRLRELKQISESKADKLQTDERSKTRGSSKPASVEQRLTSAQEEPQTKTSFSATQITFPPTSSFMSPQTAKINSSLLSKQLKNSKERKALANSYNPSSLKRTKRIPFNGNNAATNRFSSLEITLKSKILSLIPELSSSSEATKSPPSKKSSSTGLLSNSIDEMPAMDILSNFFQHAGSAGVRTFERKKNLKQGNVRKLRDEIPNKSSSKQDTRWPANQKHIYVENTRQQKRDQKDDYELQLLEFQKKAIEEEEKRLKEQFGPQRQKIELNKESRLEQLNQRNNEKEREVHLLFEKFTKTDKKNASNNLIPSTHDTKNNNNDSLNGDDGDVVATPTKASPNRRRRKSPDSKDKGVIKKQRTINVGGDYGNDDEITEVAFYDKQDDITGQSKSINGLLHSKKGNVSKELGKNVGKHFGTKDEISLPTYSDNEASNTLIGNKMNRTQDFQNKTSLLQPVKLDEKKTHNINKKKSKGSLEDKMENEDLMDDTQKQYRKESKIEEHPVELQNNKYKKKDSDNSMESNGKKGSDKVDVDVDIVSDIPDPPIFTEIKEQEEQGDSNRITAKKKLKVNEYLDTKSKQEMTDFNTDSESDMSDTNNKDNGSGDSSNNNNNNDHNNNNNNSDDNNSNNNNNNNSDDNNNNSDDNNNNSSSKQKIENDNNSDNVMLRDNRLVYILTGEGAKPPPKQKSTEPSNNIKEMTNVKESSRDRVTNQWGHETEIIRDNKRLNNEKPLVQRQRIINKRLKAKIKEIHNRILNAHNRVSQELEQIEQELSTKFETLQESMSMAKTLTSSIDSKINSSVLRVMNLATSSAKQAKNKLELVQKAAAALNNIEERIGANETRNFAKILKHQLPDLSTQKNKTYQKILAINNVITKMDGARLIALDKANISYNVKAKIESTMSEVAGNVLDELKSTERELNDDTEMEIEDEIEADRKIRDAKTRNYKAAVKTAQALEKIEGYLEQLENDENRLRGLEN